MLHEGVEALPSDREGLHIVRQRRSSGSGSQAPDLYLGLHRYRRSLCNHASRNTPGTYTNPPTLTTLVDDLHRLKVRQPTATCFIVRVANIVTGRGTLSASVAHSSHFFIPALFESLTYELSSRWRRLHQFRPLRALCRRDRRRCNGSRIQQPYDRYQR